MATRHPGRWSGERRTSEHVPILAPGGEVIGSLCVIDEKPHVWQPAELAALSTLARAASNEVSLRASLNTARASLRVSQELARGLQDNLAPGASRDPRGTAVPRPGSAYLCPKDGQPPAAPLGSLMTGEPGELQIEAVDRANRAEELVELLGFADIGVGMQLVAG